MDQSGQQDLYEMLQVSPQAHPMVITRVFRLLAGLYHPDNRQTGDADAFKRLVEAYRVLSDPIRRAAYDQERFGSVRSNWGAEAEIRPAAPRQPIAEPQLRLLILRALYDVRRGRPYKPCLSLMVLSELCGCSIESLQFTLWYLRGKRFIEDGEDADLAITVGGVDYLEAQGSTEEKFWAGRGEIEGIASLPLFPAPKGNDRSGEDGVKSGKAV